MGKSSIGSVPYLLTGYAIIKMGLIVSLLESPENVKEVFGRLSDNSKVILLSCKH